MVDFSFFNFFFYCCLLFFEGWLRSLGGAYSLMRDVVGNENDFGYESIYFNHNQFRSFLSKMLCQYCNRVCGRNKIQASTKVQEKYQQKIVKNNLSIMNDLLNKDLDSSTHFPQPKSNPKMFRSLSKIVRDKLERKLWTIFKYFGYRSSHGIMLVNYDQMLNLAQKHHLIVVTSNASTSYKHLGYNQNNFNQASLFHSPASSIHTGITRGEFIRYMKMIIFYTNGIDCSIEKKGGINVEELLFTFPDFVLLITYITLVAPNFMNHDYNDKIEQMMRTMHISNKY
jgi:hypothetical protein